MSAERGGKGGSGLSNTSRPLLYRLVTTLREEGFLERSDDHSGLVLGRRLSEIAEYFARQ